MDDVRILDAWSAGRRRPEARRLLLLAAACPGTPAETLAGLTAGRSNLLLLRDRRDTLGSRLEGETTCPACDARLEVAVDLSELLGDADASADDEAADDGDSRTAADGELRSGDCVVCFRLPTVRDLQTAAAVADPESAARVLLRSCVVSFDRAGELRPVDDLPTELLHALDTELGRRDPHADLRLSASCPGCEHTFELVLDPVSLYWDELEARARRLLLDVHRLADRYGWSERECLGIDPLRRAGYLELIG
ncbi:T4 family baseplate hub assembly chaperone [Streptomyces triculaminicus]|uniref:T4 family baseplate hub assembly chaperone n=1 Tax=Streptomyces triculaminicus TaxID=2816232 RepID=UPI0037D7B946